MLVDFHQAAHWRAGVRHNLSAQGDRLVVPGPLGVEPLPGTGPADAGALIADTGHGMLWLRPHTRELIHRTPAAVVERGILHGRGPARRFAAGRTILWVLAGNRLDRYDASTLQRLSPAELTPRWWVADLVAGGDDDVWLVATGPGGRWRLRNLDRWGRPCRDPIDVSDAGRYLRLAATADRTRLVLIDPLESSAALVVSTRDAATTAISLDPVHHHRPTLLAAGARIHLLTSLDAAGTTVHQVVDPDNGQIDDHQELRVPPSLGSPRSLTGTLLLGCTRGLGRIVARDSAPDRQSTFITPALLAPAGPPAGWNRAEADVLLPAGTSMELNWASTSDPVLAARAGRLLAGPPAAGLADDLDALLPWHPAPISYPGGHSDDVERLAISLDAVEHGTLWLRIRLRTPPGRTPPQLVRLRAGHSLPGYAGELPAPYRDDPRTAPQLGRILAPYEVLFDGLDEKLAGLPDRIDPRTAPDDWTGYLLGWLGFPPLGDLPAPIRRELLRQAGSILELRGTRAGLELLLDLVTGGRATVRDSADDPPCWVLGPPAADAAGAPPARLGHDTLVLAQQPGPARAGAIVAGTTRLGHGCPDPARLTAERASLVTVELHRARAVAPIVERLLPSFVPAHCRLRVVHTSGPGTGLRLRSDDDWPLGTSTRLGYWPLAAPDLPPAVLDSGAPLSAGPRPS
ncbi:phage tail-like protein [Actinoplanes lutulentus]|uniref:Phage tail-like protein n=1 Tax=Actinoplanes lutulentus TaxID=1287878 RepID=A0A327ZG32_9ACTN|nr:hypothetical protein [Actinoplanes lutulentus]MBB2948484.1 phage tail-like protein [Actinoplanes lutulentus]RAK34484.1 phage tail-like protein [Actinoplanes lutulentus]